MGCLMAFGLVGAAEASLLMIGPLRVTGYAGALAFIYALLIGFGCGLVMIAAGILLYRRTQYRAAALGLAVLIGAPSLT